MYSNTPNPPSKFTATMWGKTVTIELDHSDFDLSELMDIFKGLAIASGFEMTSWNNVIKDTASEIYNEEHEIVKEALDTSDDECNECNDEFENLRHSYEDATELDNDFFGSWGSVEEESVNERMDIIGQNGNEGTHYDDEELVWGDEDELDTPTDEYKGIYSSHPTYDWDNETNDILTNINDSITIIKDRMEDIDMRMDNIDEQLDILNADVANIELNIAFPPPNEHIIKAKDLYDRAVKVHERDKQWRKDVVDMETGEVTNNGEVNYDNDGGFAVKMNKSKVKKGKFKDLKK
jgi:hypothetical protein